MLNVFIQGLLLQASLILVLGAQNLFVIEVGLKRTHHLLAATICAVCDILLIMLGVLGVSAILVNVAELKIAIGVLGALFLGYYAILKFKEVYHGVAPRVDSLNISRSKKNIILTTLSFTLLNPHVYLDTFFLIGGYSIKFDLQSQKIAFALGAGFFSILWFYFLAFFSAHFSKILSQDRNLKITSFITGMILGYLSIKLGWESVSGVF
jgi:L-lysine exporter family protein LysE/ArgO